MNIFRILCIFALTWGVGWVDIPPGRPSKPTNPGCSNPNRHASVQQVQAIAARR